MKNCVYKSLKIPRDLHGRLRLLAAQREEKMGELVVRLLERGLRQAAPRGAVVLPMAR